mmetsp:Transcript_15684/g.20346  ORF Transcript_15684/g.20346 Transcript_15684/m.20346 type:complete len:856 (-) Transcript_15684:375-2942(-)
MFICDPSVVDTQTNRFMKKYLSPKQEVFSLSEFTEVLLSECHQRRLNKWECFFLIFEDPSSSKLSYIVAVVIMILILVSSISFVLSTDPAFQVASKNNEEAPQPHPVFLVIEQICIYCFLIEYLSRVFVVWAVRDNIVGSGTQKFALLECFPHNEYESHHSLTTETPTKWSTLINRTYTYVMNPMNLIDLVAILPFFISKLVANGDSGSLSSLRILRLARVMRIFKLAKKNEGINMLSTTMSMSRGSLNLLVFFGIIGTVLFGSLIYFTESGTWHNPEECAKALPDFDGCNKGMYLRPDKFGRDKELTPFSSIPRTFWWVVVTATTVGYGDMYPTTGLGKLVATVTMVCGLLVLALPISIIGTNFLVCYEKLDEKNRRVRIMEELEEKLRNEEKEALLEAKRAEKARRTREKDAVKKMNWPRRQTKTEKASSPMIVSESKSDGFPLPDTPQPVDNNQGGGGTSQGVLGRHSRFGGGKLGAAISATSWTFHRTHHETAQAAISASAKTFNKNTNIRSLHRLMTRKKSMVDGHHSLIGLKAKARMVPSFLFDANVAINPPANLTFVNIDRKSKILALSLATYGKGSSSTRRPSMSSISDIAIVVKYKPMLDKAQAVLECIQTLHTRGKIDDPTVLNVAREVLDLTRKLILLRERQLSPSLRLIGAEVDAAIQVILAWLGRDADCFFGGDELDEEDEEDSLVLEAEDERRVRLLLFSFTVSALEVAKPKPSDRLRSPLTTSSSPERLSPARSQNADKVKNAFTSGAVNSLMDTQSGSAPSAPNTFTPHSSDHDTISSQFGEGSFRVKMGDHGINFTLIAGTSEEEGVDVPKEHDIHSIEERNEVESSWWWHRWGFLSQ